MADNMKLFLEMVAKTGAFTRGLSNSSGAVRKFTAGAKRELAGLKNMFSSVQGQAAGLGLTIGAGKILTDSALLDKSLIRIKQTAGGTREAIKSLRADLFGMGRESGKQIENLKDGFNDLVQSGLDMRESTASLGAVNVAMAVTEAKARSLTAGLTVGAKAFDFDLGKPGQALEMLDQMTVAGRLGNAELEDLSGVFSRIGQNAKAANLGFGNTLAFVETLSLIEKNPERLATLADSTLRVFSNLRYMAAAQKGTGVQFFDADGARRGALDVLADIKTEYAKLTTDMARARFIQRAFGKADLDTIKGLRALFSGDALNSLNRFSKEIANAGGTLKKDFDEAMSNLPDQVNLLKNDLRAAADAFVVPVNNALARWIKHARADKAAGGWGMDGKDMLLGGGLALGGGILAARYAPRAVRGLANKFLKGGGELGVGIAKGKAIEAATGVQPVYVTNMSEGFGGGSALDMVGGKGKGGIAQFMKKAMGAGKGSRFLPAGAGLVKTAGGVGLAGAGGYAVGTGINELAGAIAGRLTGGKYGGSGWLGSMIYDAIHGNDGAKKTELNVYIDKDDRVTTKTSMGHEVNATARRGSFM